MSERKQVDAYFKLLKKQASKHPKQVTISLRQKKKKKKNGLPSDTWNCAGVWLTSITIQTKRKKCESITITKSNRFEVTAAGYIRKAKARRGRSHARLPPRIAPES